MAGDDVFLRPIAGVKVSIVGLPDQVVTTGPDGRFSFSSVPSGDVKLAIDGRTATNPPAGYFFPEIVMDLTIRPGTANTVMGSMSTPTGEGVDPTDLGVYLPRVSEAILQSVGQSAPTTITTPAVASKGLTPEQRESLTMTVAPGSLVGPDGQAIAPRSIQGRADGRVVELGYETLPGGDYEFRLAAPSVTDRAGNPLGSAPRISRLHVAGPQFLEFGDEDLLGFGYSPGVDPKRGATFEGLAPGQVSYASTTFRHDLPSSPHPGDYPATDRIFVGSGQTGSHDPYADFAGRQPGTQAFDPDYRSLLPAGQDVATFTLGVAFDDIQSRRYHQPFIARINGVEDAALTQALNDLDLTGPRTGFLAVGIDPSILSSSGVLHMTIDEAGDGGDGWAVDFLTIAITTKPR